MINETGTKEVLEAVQKMINETGTKQGFRHLGHFYMDRDEIDLEYFLDKALSGRIAVIGNDVLSGQLQETIIELPGRFNPQSSEHVIALGVEAVDMFEFKIKFDEPEFVTFRFNGSVDEYLNGVFRCRFEAGQRGSFGCPFGC